MAENRVAGERKTIIQIMNMRFWLTLLLGTLLIVLSHFVLDKKTPESASLVGTIFHEAGFALIVALVIWGMFEFFSQVEKDDIWNDRIEKIAKNVFFGVFRRNFPPDLIKEATELLLEQTFIRSGLHATYVLRDDKYRDSAGNDMSYVRLETVARFKIRNVTNMNAQYPIRIALPNPLHPGMKEKCSVNRLTIRRKGISEYPSLAEAEKRFREQLTGTVSEAVFAVEPLTLSPDEEIEVIWDYVMAKEGEDSEIMQTLYPTDSLAIAIVDSKPEKRAVLARSIHPAPLEDDSSAQAKGAYNFHLNRYLLPHQGFVIWWKNIH